jgi:hypothetical protein
MSFNLERYREGDIATEEESPLLVDRGPIKEQTL